MRTPRTVYQYTPEGLLISQHDSLSAAARSVEGTLSVISQVCNHVLKTAYGYRWSYEEITDYQVIAPKPRSDSRKVFQFSLDGTLVATHDSGGEAGRALGLFSSANITRACHKGVTAYGYRWSYTDAIVFTALDNRRQRVIMTSDNEVREFNSLTEGAAHVGTTRALLSKYISSKRPHKGYTWRYAE